MRFWFQFRLFVYLVGFANEAIGIELWNKRAFFAFLLVFTTLLYPQLSPAPTPIVLPVLKNDEYFSQQLLSTEQHRAEVAFWTTLLTLQPTHRDVLLNAALFTAPENHEAALNFWERARKSDPNHPVFVVTPPLLGK